MSEQFRPLLKWLAVGFLLTFCSSFGQTFFISIFAGEIRQIFSLSHGQWGLIYSLATLGSALVMVFVGGVTDKYRVREIGPLIILTLAGGALIMAGSNSLLTLGLALFLLRLMGQGLLGHTAMVAMARWFVSLRGRAISLAGLGVTLGEALLPLFYVSLLTLFPWRWLWLASAVFLLLMIPLLRLWLRQEKKPESFSDDHGSLGMGAVSWSRTQVLKHGLFWAMVPAILGPAAWNTSLFFHQVYIAEVKNWSHLSLVALFPLYSGASLVFMLVSGWIIDRYGCAKLTLVYLLPMAAGYALLGLFDYYLSGALAMILIGSSAGMHSTMGTAFWAEFYGTQHLGKIRAMTTALMVLGTAIGPVVTGVWIDSQLSFQALTFSIAIYFLMATLSIGPAALRASKTLQ